MGGSARALSKAAVLDYLYAKHEELQETILRGEGPTREAAKERRAFLERQLGIVHGGGEWRAKLDPALAEAVRQGVLRGDRIGSRSSTSQSLAKEPAKLLKTQPKEEPLRPAPTAPRAKPTYEVQCERMDFHTLRAYVDDSLRGLSDPARAEGPRTKEQFLSLLELLREKASIEQSGDRRRAPRTPSGRLKALYARRDRLRTAVHKAERDWYSRRSASPKKLRKELGALGTPSSAATPRGGPTIIYVFYLTFLRFYAIIYPWVYCRHGGGRDAEAKGAEAAEGVDVARAGGALRGRVQHDLEAGERQVRGAAPHDTQAGRRARG